MRVNKILIISRRILRFYEFGRDFKFQHFRSSSWWVWNA